MKKFFYVFVLSLFTFVGCQKPEQGQFFDGDTGKMLGKSDKVTICHSTGNGAFQTVSVPQSALKAHLNHGDYILDADGDGYTAVGACEGTKNDCNDNDASISPAASEVCGDGIDNNCNGIIDEECGPDFSVFYIRNSNLTANKISAPWDTDIILSENAAGDGFTYGTPRGGQKVGYGTKFFDGYKINSISSTNWNLVYGNPGVGPYLNIWVTDGLGNYAVIASENQYKGTDFATRREWKIFEYGTSTSNFNWLFDGGTGGRDASQYLTHNGTRVTLSQLSDRIIIGDPGSYPLPNVGTGAPRGGYGFNLIWGDTQANFTQKNGQIAGLTVSSGGVTHVAAD
ncbi:putative metal-binding motif-containing protein [Daejeonella lutea]|uniref:Putative metal-binding motif-containing protein n=1 Tax=Daejeonella lutea TaxID=572036 RepID=A0A1T5BD68_9SPHI|nr:putative metal-binding motif-containing protein [Daejeonella lutea]SKB44783.1 Putative metal-binding motif-containing protein [Daejeonella lutea]